LPPSRPGMDNEFEKKHRKSYIQFRMVYDFTIAGLLLGMAFILFFGDRFGLDLIAGLDPLMRFSFAGLCFLYGGFRAYRAIKHDY
jgi:uncharacterized membrane protein